MRRAPEVQPVRSGFGGGPAVPAGEEHGALPGLAQPILQGALQLEQIGVDHAAKARAHRRRPALQKGSQFGRGLVSGRAVQEPEPGCLNVRAPIPFRRNEGRAVSQQQRGGGSPAGGL